jgi:hypothetical protein
LDSTSNSAARDKGHTGALYAKNSDPAAKVWMELFTTTLDLYGGVLWSGELQGFITQQMMPTMGYGLWAMGYGLVLYDRKNGRIRCALLLVLVLVVRSSAAAAAL